MSKVILVGCGGFIGASARYLISLASTKLINTFPIGTFIENVLGCFLIGIVMESAFKYGNISSDIRLFLTTGILGGLTTFSTFSYETIDLILKGKTIAGILNVMLTVGICLFAVYLAKILVKVF